MNILNMYVTLMPVILAGILNMIFTKTGLYKKHAHPIDRGKNFLDGKRVFGDNKTVIGFFSMILINAFTQIVWGLLCKTGFLAGRSELYSLRPNTVPFNLHAGLLFGFAYMLFELPNSFIKRRFDIKPGTTECGFVGRFFFVFDQIDSLFGVCLVLAFFTPISVGKYFFYILLGGITHISVNLILYKLKIRKHL